ncbi:MAG: dihydrodipicolinate synthase family protein [Ruminococcaceae bacterium]|nr:dihydrodipicolinate synthase family protein [Oscillospiraceae bacterium]
MNRHNTALQILHEGTVIPAIPLTLDENRAFDPVSQRRIVRYYLTAGAGGIAAAVHSTQFEIREPKHNLFRPVLEAVIAEIEDFEKKTGRTVVRVAGVCGKAPQACREAELAKSLGFDAVLLSPGGLADLTEEDLLERTKAVAEVMPVIGFYLQEAVGGRKLSRAYWRSLSDIPGVVAIKCACFERYRTQDLVKGVMESARADEVALYTGNDDHIVMDLITPFVHEGKKKYFVGGLLGQWSVWTKSAVEIFGRCRETQKTGIIPAELLTVAEHLTEANGAVFDVANRFAGCIPGLHYVLKKQGIMKSLHCLNPDEILSPGQAEEIDRLWKAYPEIADDSFVEAFMAQEKE